MIAKLQGTKGQIEKSIDSMADLLEENEFQDYCDHAYSCISYIRQSINNLEKQSKTIKDD